MSFSPAAQIDGQIPEKHVLEMKGLFMFPFFFTFFLEPLKSKVEKKFPFFHFMSPVKWKKWR